MQNLLNKWMVVIGLMLITFQVRKCSSKTVQPLWPMRMSLNS